MHSSLSIQCTSLNPLVICATWLAALLFSTSPASANFLIFDQGLEWRNEIRGEGTVSSISPLSNGEDTGVSIDFDFESTSQESVSVWAGISSDSVLIPESTSALSFRVSSPEGCLLKFSIKDSAGIGYDLALPVTSGGAWEEQTILLDRSSFTSRWGKTQEEMPDTITFPIVDVRFSVMKSLDYPLKGSVQIADPVSQTRPVKK